MIYNVVSSPFYIKYCYYVSLLPPAPVFESGNVDSGDNLLKEGERSLKKYLKIHFEEKRRSFSRNLSPRSRKGSVNQQWRVKSFKSQQWRLKNHKMPYGNKYGQLLLYHLLEFSIYYQTRFSRYKNGMCYHSSWVAVHGMDCVSMVTRRQEMDMTRVDAYYQRFCTNQQTMRSYAEAIICDVEALAYDDELREKLNKSIVRPFGVVSLVPDTKIIHEESGHEEASIADYAAVKPSSKATMFLKEKMNSRSAFTFAETVQTAIRAFQYLCLEELKAEDIWVTTLQIAKNQFVHMHLDQRKEHLGVICGGSSGGL